MGYNFHKSIRHTCCESFSNLENDARRVAYHVPSINKILSCRFYVFVPVFKGSDPHLWEKCGEICTKSVRWEKGLVELEGCMLWQDLNFWSHCSEENSISTFGNILIIAIRSGVQPTTSASIDGTRYQYHKSRGRNINRPRKKIPLFSDASKKFPFLSLWKICQSCFWKKILYILKEKCGENLFCSKF